MTSTQYQNFVTVAECRSITRAAKELMIAQPALTSQIKRMEDVVGTPLFIRHSRFVELTEAGEIFYQSAKNILQMEENYAMGIRNLLTVGGTLKLGITPFLPDPGFQKGMTEYYRAFPNIAVDLYEENTENLLSKLESGMIELAVVVSFQQLPPVFEVLHESNSYLYACYCSDSHILDTEDNEDISFSRLHQVPICVPRSMYRTLLELSHQLDIKPLWKAVSDSRHASLQLAQSGNLVAVLALRDQIKERMTMVCNRITDKQLTGHRYVIKVHGKKLSTAAENFLENVNLDIF